MTATIYVLVDSRITDPVARVRYVGRTVAPPYRRWFSHRYTAFHGDRTARGCWIRSVYAAGGTVMIEVVATVPVETVDAAEIEWIAKYRALGCRLTNHTDGGGGQLNACPETRRKIGESKRGNTYWVGRHHAPESCAKISAAHRGRVMPAATRAVVHSAEARAKMAATLRARVLTPEELQRKRAVVALSWHTADARVRQRAAVNMPEHRARISARQSTPEAIERARRMGLANRGRTHTEDFKSRYADRMRGTSHTDATKQKMSAWQRGADSHRAKLTWADVETIRACHAAGGVSQHQLAREFNVQPRTINLIVHRKTWVAA